MLKAVVVAVLVGVPLAGRCAGAHPHPSETPPNPYVVEVEPDPGPSFEDRVIDWARNAVGPRQKRGTHWLLRKRGEEARVRRMVRYAEEVTEDLDFGAALVLAVALRESGWMEGVRGARGEVGLMQLHGVALGEYRHRPPIVWHPKLNLRLGAQHLQRAISSCVDDVRWGLGAYATGVCRPPRDPEDTMVVRWAYEMLSGDFERASGT